MYNAVVVKLKNVIKHPNADKLQLSTVVGCQIIVGLDNHNGDLGVYFPTDGQLSEEFCIKNDLLRRKNEDETLAGGMFDNNRRVRTQKLRGEISDGFWIPISAFDYLKTKELVEGYEFNKIGDKEICCRYETPTTKQYLANVSGKKANIGSIMFKEHMDTGQLGRNIENIPINSLLIITEKLHGTSQRIGNVLVDRNKTKFEKFLSFFGTKIQTKEWQYLNGTRRVVIKKNKFKDNSFHTAILREKAIEPFKDKLNKGETVYFEVVGFDNQKPIMSSVSTKVLPDIRKLYGDNITFSYGCNKEDINSFDIYVYRITNTNEDGISIDLSWQDLKDRCNQIGIKYVPELTVPFFYTGGDYILQFAEDISKGSCTFDNRHIKEGICIRVESGTNLKIYKHKSFEFKVLEGIIKDSDIIDIEESN